THARAGNSIRAVCHSGLQPDLRKHAAALIEKQEVRNRVVGNEQVEQAIVIDVGRDRAKGLALVLSDSRTEAHIREPAISIVAVQAAWPCVIAERIAVMRNAVIA